MQFQRIARRDKKVFLSDQCKEIEGKNRLRKLEIPREYFMQRGQKEYGPHRSRTY